MPLIIQEIYATIEPRETYKYVNKSIDRDFPTIIIAGDNGKVRRYSIVLELFSLEKNWLQRINGKNIA
ncbi:MAG: hypothetical protein NDF54_03040 [archaeon GB-1867-035]|nr:hypothetical protein [Candidatus Culexmicrobium profundum]